MSYFDSYKSYFDSSVSWTRDDTVIMEINCLGISVVYFI